MRHDLPKKIQLLAPNTPWWKSEPLKMVYELIVLGAAFTASAWLVAGLVQ